ncbi:DEAD/DEAH box helicase [Undibacterium baiyunense]|uniref:DEAD/DEAH box helicase n=1 Tax=Undibacterium baiyunense TaxID=2828731 RepID=A0A941DFN9_9BURK|nr:DEAD/DEAH box helicase [Undibacterium baiyunense]MBR7747924.1 DEAD/DEAH box helicase [Undibacterium baiyunense]
MHQFDHLKAQEFAFLYALALLDSPLSQNVMLELLLQRRESFGKAGEVPGVIAVRDQLAVLHEKQLVSPVSGKGYVLNEGLQMPLIAHLLEYSDIHAWISSIRVILSKREEYKHWKVQNAAFCRRELFFSCLINEIDGIAYWRNEFFEARTGDKTVLAEQLFKTNAGQLIFNQFSAFSKGILLSDLFYQNNWTAGDIQAAYQYALENLAQLGEGIPLVLEQLIWQTLLRADFATLKKLTAYCLDEHQSTHAFAVAISRGNYALALEQIEAITKIIKKNTGKRKVHLGDLLGLLYTVCLFAVDSTDNRKKLKEQVDDGIKQNDAFTYYLLESLTNHIAKGTPLTSKRFVLQRELGVETLFECLALFWESEPIREDAHQRLRAAYQRYATHGYQWLAAEADALLAKHYGDAPQMADWHAQHQLPPLYSCFQREESWQRALTALSQLNLTTNNDNHKAPTETRLVWQLSVLRDHAIIEPREQKVSAKGVWSKGRPIALKRLVQEQEGLTYLSEQDKQVIDCVRKTLDGYYGHAEYALDIDKALPLLINHPQVYWSDAPDIRVDIVKGELTLFLKEKNDHISLQLEPPITAQQAYVARKETPTRLAIYSSSPEIKQIASILGSGLTVPSAAKSQLVDVIAAIAPHLAIHSDLPELAQHIHTVAADATLYAHLLPLKEGLRLQLLVRPLAQGAWLMPAKGASNVLGEIDGKTVQASRDLAAENTALQNILASCPAFAEADSVEESNREWQWQTPEQCLELLSQLKAIPEQQLQLVWPEGERFRLQGQRSLGNMRLSIKKQGEWFVAGGEVTLDDGRVLALRELMQMAETTKGRFLKIGEHDFIALTESFRKRLDELRHFAELSGKDGIRINSLAAPALAELADEVGELKVDKAWREQVEKLDALANFTPQVPSTLQAQLRDYQLEGFQWLARLAKWGVGACLADDMGLGKTVQTLALLIDRAPNGPALVVAPISVAMNWQSEVARFAPTLKIRAYQQERSLQDLGAFDIVIASYGMLQQDAASFAAQHWHSIVLDEAQVIKNAATKRSQAAMALSADFKMIASGTPVENHLGELWNLFRFINPGLLGSKEHFIDKFSAPIERGDKAARAHLKKLIQAFILRRTKTQVLSELPPRTEINLQVELNDEERHLYEALRQEAIDKIAQIDPTSGQSMQVLAEITKLRRFCCHPKLVMKNANISGSKLAVLQHTVEELLDNRHKALVFSQFVDHLALVRDWLDQQGITYQYLDGSTPAQERKKRVDAFQAGHGDIFLISLKAGGTGLNLTAADYVIHLDPWWNPAVEDQASDRAHRMGQQRPVTIYRLVTQDTIEEKILALHAEKRDLADSLLDGGDAAARMDTAALLRLLKESA